MLAQFGKLLRAIAEGGDPKRIPTPTEVIPIFPASDYQPSFGYSVERYLWIGYAHEAAVAGVPSQVGLVNPTGTGVVATVTKLWAASEDDTLRLRAATAAQVAGFDFDGNEYPRDNRLRISTWSQLRHACDVISDAAAMVGDAMAWWFPHHEKAGGEFTYSWDVPLVLCPGSAYVVTTESNQKMLDLSLAWEERRYDPEEIQGVRQDLMR